MRIYLFKGKNDYYPTVGKKFMLIKENRAERKVSVSSATLVGTFYVSFSWS